MKEMTSRKIAAALFFVAGLIISFYGVTFIFKAAKCKSWPMAQGTILHSSPIDSRDIPENKTKDVLRPYIVYEYMVGDKYYTSNNIAYLNVISWFDISDTYFSGSYAEVMALLRKYPVYHEVKVHYNPENVDDAVLDTGLKAPIFMPFILGLLLTYISFHVYIYGLTGHFYDKKHV
ncbi:MAG TPA: hypothetical protein DCZ94_07865 [Lentisphaeria bacterium]|nr:MAG: hypothetical protein A2X48_24265 [Lentisphaerae bacterium GWF2_49_21]HBC86853.1 hypothetical protein [Lentisphaeria bacterium]